jgi:hypothetical protein
MPPRKYIASPCRTAFLGDMKKEWLKHNEAMDKSGIRRKRRHTMNF